MSIAGKPGQSQMGTLLKSINYTDLKNAYGNDVGDESFIMVSIL